MGTYSTHQLEHDVIAVQYGHERQSSTYRWSRTMNHRHDGVAVDMRDGSHEHEKQRHVTILP